MPKSSTATEIPIAASFFRICAARVAVLHHGRFGDLQLEPRRVDAGLATTVARPCAMKSRVMNWTGEMLTATKQSGGRRRASAQAWRSTHSPIGADHAGLLGDGDELGRRDHAALGMVPAHQRLVADDPAGHEVELRLVVEMKVAALEGDVQLGLDPLAVVGDLAHARDRNTAQSPMPERAGVLQRQIGAAQQP